MKIFSKLINHEPKKHVQENSESVEIENSISDQDLLRLYAVEYKSQSYSSFYNTTMEKDKSILTLSVAGIGFLITLLKLSDMLSYCDVVFFSLATSGYLVSIFCVVTIFDKNADYVIDLVNEKDVTKKQGILKLLDVTSIRAFYLAIIMSVCLGVSTSSTLFLKGKKDMTQDNNLSRALETQLVPSTESYRQATNLQESFQGAVRLQPSTNSQTTLQSNNKGAAAMMPNTNIEKK